MNIQKDIRVLVWKSTGTKFNPAAWNRSGVGSVNATCLTGRVIAGDFNGDGKCDIIGMYLYPEGNLRTLIWKSQTTSFTNAQEIYNIGTTFKESQLTGKITCADFNKDGKSDIGLVTTDTTTKGAAYVFTSTGTVCNAPTKWWDTKNATSYKYNANGIRTQKTVNGVVTDYYLEGNNVIYEKTGSSIIYYTYDSAGRVVGINDNGTQYYYIRNAQEDIVGILNSSFGVVAQYRYDSWGKIVSICDNAGNDISGNIGHIANKNPYRYRGYRYDTETGLYYLQSRYYNPEWGRFINADIQLDTNHLIGLNMYAYCGNNPIIRLDTNGEFWSELWNIIKNVWNNYCEWIDKPYKETAKNIASITADTIATEENYQQIYNQTYQSAYTSVKISTSYISGTINIKPLVNQTALPQGKNITGYTKHGINSAINHQSKGVNTRSILNTVKNPIKEPISQVNGKIKYIGSDSVVILNSNRKVITTWPTSHSGYRIK